MQTAEYDQQIRINALGMRAPEVPPKADDELRILAVATPSRSAFRLKRTGTPSDLACLSERLGRPVRSGTPRRWARDLPCGRPGPSVRTPIEADLVLYLFFTGNDLFDNMGYAQATRNVRRTPPPQEPRDTPANWLARRSMLAMYTTVMVRAFDIGGAGNGARHHQELAIFTDPAALASQGTKTAEGLRTLGSTCEELEIACHVAVAGPAFTVHAERADTTFWLFGHEPEDVDLDAPARFVASAAPSNLPVRDLAPALRTKADGPPLYFTLDGHWTEAGHAVVAADLTEWVAASLPR